MTTENALRHAITQAYRADETHCINALIYQAQFSTDALERINKTATQLVLETRKHRKQLGGLDVFLHEYDLSSEEGIALMCLAEALLRIPDNETIDRLISDKISTAEWDQHLNTKDTLFVNAATWSLMLTGKIYAPTLDHQKTLTSSLKRLISRAGGSVIRPLILQGMKLIGKQFVMGRTIEEALTRARKNEALGYRYSFDMLGESARTKADAQIYFNHYLKAIHAIGQSAKNGNPITSPGISVKLSALHPRYEYTQTAQVMQELVPLLLELSQAAKQYNISLAVDAEEADRLELSLDVIEKVFSDSSLNGWEGFGLAVQSYQKRAPFVLDWLANLAKQNRRRLMVRLIKGAYWDTEIKQSQVLGLEGYPVFTRKNSTDVSFIACAKKIKSYSDYFFPQFGTHNAYSVAAVLEIMNGDKNFEFQCLHGMGRTLYDQVIAKNGLDIPCRIYAPVGSHKDLLGYLVRRLLENGANTSFINRIADDNIPVEKIIIDPVARIKNLTSKPHPHIPLPRNIFKDRKNSKGVDLSNVETFAKLNAELQKFQHQTFESGPILNGKLIKTAEPKLVRSPFNTDKVLGKLYHATETDVEKAIQIAYAAQPAWGALSVNERAKCIERAADLFEENMPALVHLLCHEAGKHIYDCISEIRETVDYCRYYAEQAKKDFAIQTLPGPTGELNQFSLHPRGVFACISPWNFPLAIFSGQMLAALVSGNAVIAKPAEPTPLIAAFAVELLHKAGVPKEILHLMPGPGKIVGMKMVTDERIAGIIFTGSTETAKTIQRGLAEREGPIPVLIAETGGQNAMIVDSSALPEQVVADVITSAFNSAGQRCSALRVLFVQEDIAPKLIKMLTGAMEELYVGNPSLLSTDIGPVINEDAVQMLKKHFMAMQKDAKLLYQVPVGNLTPGYFFPPCVFELTSLDVLKREVFGPILHIIRYSAKDLNTVLKQIIDTGYGLTLGVHSRIDATVEYIKQRMPVGNVYVNRNIIGAVVGVQPFGGEGLSGTGPKAGGPYYLPRLCVERTVSVNTTAAGGNATLVSLPEE